MIEFKKSPILDYEQYIHFLDKEGIPHSNLKGSLYKTSREYKPFQLVIKYDTLTLIVKYFNTQEEVKEYLKSRENLLKNLAEQISSKIFSYKYNLVEQYKIVEERWM